MTINDLLVDQLKGNLETVKFTLADFSDDDMLVRPAPAANHTAWQLGHLVCAETMAFEAVKPGSMPPLPEGFARRFTSDTTRLDDPAAFPSKEELLDRFSEARAATTALARSLSAQELDKPTPQHLQAWAPTVGRLLAAMPEHVFMHLGQWQVVRRKLGKPILF